MGEEEEMAGSGEHPPGEIEGKQSRNPDRMEARETPRGHRRGGFQSPSWTRSLSGSEAAVGAQETKDQETLECFLEHSNSSLYLPP